jgi:hypothetical protein
MSCGALIFLAALVALVVSAAAVQPVVVHKVEASNTTATTMFYTTFTANKALTGVSWVTCGHDETSSGCYGSGSVGPFVRACAVAGNGNGRVFVMDALGGADNSAVLHIYKQNETSRPSIVEWKTVALPKMVSQDAAPCAMAVLGDFVYLGTQASTVYAQVNWKTLDAFQGTICSPPGVTSSITASKDAAVVSQSGCFVGYNKDGRTLISGGEQSTTFLAGQNAHLLA